MLNSNDIYSHLSNGGSIEELHKALENEIQAAQDRIIKEKEAELKAQKAKEKKNKAADAAFKALTDYCKAAEVEYTKEELTSLIKLLGQGNIRFGKNIHFFDRWSL